MNFARTYENVAHPRSTTALGRSKHRTYFSLLADQNSPNLACVGKNAVCKAVFRLTICCYFPDSYTPSSSDLSEICPKFWCFWAAIFFLGGGGARPWIDALRNSSEKCLCIELRNIECADSKVFQVFLKVIIIENIL